MSEKDKNVLEPAATVSAPPPTPAPPLQKDTMAGNYFVSNYPPYSFWKPEYTPQALEAFDREPKPGTPLGMYVHIPFCRKRCHFCYFKVYTDKDASAIRGYIDALLQEFSLYAKKRFVGGRKPAFVYFGGGTPSYLSVDQLRHLTDGMKALLPWDEAQEVTFECEPGTLTDHKLKAIREIGVTRLSLGVENFNDHILEINGRAHHSKEIARAYAYAREVGFPQINIDLIAGMVEETESNWRDCVEKTIAMVPDSVTIYEMEIPFNTTIYQQMKAQGKLVAPVADWETKRAWVNYAFGELEKAGYTVASAYTAVKDPAKTKFIYRDFLWAGADLLSLGVASFGHVGGVHYQNQHDFEPYVESLRQGRLPIWRALTPNEAERFIREFILQLKLGHVSRRYFVNKFGHDPAERFAEAFQRLRDWGFLSVHGDAILLDREGLLQVDKLLHEFFLPEHRTSRYA
jgi:oxygen-independent coproporphyrinogen-3 oxidase